MKCVTKADDPYQACVRCGSLLGLTKQECKTQHLMVDIETLGNGPRSVITQIGACWFDMDGTVGSTFSVNINIQSALDANLIIDGDTIKWWFDQPNPTWLKDAIPITKALCQFATFCNGAKNVWSHATFDMPILFNAYRELGIKIPFHYRAPRDIRTLVWLWGGKFDKDERVGAHDGLSDAIYQVKYCTQIYKDIQDARNPGN